jgi:hypothetical protein
VTTDPRYSQPGHPLRRLSDDLHELAQSFADHAVTLGEVLDKLGARASALLVIVCALPFCSPITIPGFSTPFGFVILLLSLGYAFGQPPWLPRKLRGVKLPPKFFSKVLEVGSKLVGWIERQLRPRFDLIADRPWKHRLHTLVVCAAAGLLLLPLPPFPPFTNTLPALVIVVLTMSILERDGVMILAGHALFVLTVGYFAFWGAVIIEAVTRILEKVGVLAG